MKLFAKVRKKDESPKLSAVFYHPFSFLLPPSTFLLHLTNIKKKAVSVINRQSVNAQMVKYPYLCIAKRK